MQTLLFKIMRKIILQILLSEEKSFESNPVSISKCYKILLLKKPVLLCIPVLKEIIIINLFVYILSKVQFKRYREIYIHISY